jgi:type III secretion system FlhB-like substrate exporter
MAIAERRKYSLMLAKFSLAREIPPAIYQLIAPSYWEQKKLYLISKSNLSFCLKTHG